MIALATSPNATAAVRVKVGPDELPARAYADLLDVRVEESVDAPGMFALRLNTWDPKAKNLSWVEDRTKQEQFAVGRPLTIEMGYLGALEEILDGEITGIELDLAASELPIMTVRGYDRSHRMSRTTTSASFSGMTDSEIARKIARTHGLRADVGDSGVKHPHVFQLDQTDLDFLRQRARRVRYEVMVQRGTLRFRPRDDARPPSVTLSAGRDVIDFSPRLTTRGLASDVEVHGWDQKQKKPIIGRATASNDPAMGGTSGARVAEAAFGTAKIVKVNIAVSTKEEADQAAKAVLADLSHGYVSGHGTCFGRAGVQAGGVIGIEGIGRFDGPYEVVASTHTYAPKIGYRTSFDVRRNAER